MVQYSPFFGGISGFRVGSMGDKMRYASHELNIPISALIASEPVVLIFLFGRIPQSGH